MHRQFSRALGITCALFALATTAQAQGKGHGDDHGDKDHGKVAAAHHDDHGTVNGVNHDQDNGHRVPPGLAKKPGQMPPGQYKKLYSTSDGANTLSDVLRRHGYRVDRTATSGNSRYVYYRTSNGSLHRAIVSPGTSQLSFQNVPSSLLQEIRSRLH